MWTSYLHILLRLRLLRTDTAPLSGLPHTHGHDARAAEAVRHWSTTMMILIGMGSEREAALRSSRQACDRQLITDEARGLTADSGSLAWT
jgi:hypothetical protein